jgi:hypothetical protein
MIAVIFEVVPADEVKKKELIKHFFRPINFMSSWCFVK